MSDEDVYITEQMKDASLEDEAAGVVQGEILKQVEREEKNEMVNNVIQPDPTVTGEVLDDVIEGALNDSRERMFLLKLEHDIEKMLSDPTKDKLELPTMSSYHRLIAHRAADHFKLAHMAVNTPAPNGFGRAVVLFKTSESRMPKIRFLNPEEIQTQPQQTMKIMSRGRSGDSEVLADGSNLSTDAEKEAADQADLAEREKKYIQARARIFNEQPRPLDSEPSLYEEPPEDSVVPEGSRGKVKSIIRDGSCAYDPAFDRRLVQPQNPMAGQYMGSVQMMGGQRYNNMGGMVPYPGMRPSMHPVPPSVPSRFCQGMLVPPHFNQQFVPSQSDLAHTAGHGDNSNSPLYSPVPLVLGDQRFVGQAPHLVDPRGPMAYASVETIVRGLNLWDEIPKDFEDSVNAGKVLRIHNLHLARPHEIESIIQRVHRCGPILAFPSPNVALAIFRTRDGAENTRKALQLGRVTLEVYTGAE